MCKDIQNINELPSINDVKRILQGFALMDSILMPEWEYRYFSFNCNWDGNGNESMASMRDGEGNEFFLQFINDLGVAGKVFSKDQLEDASLYLNYVPDSFSEFKNEEAYDLENATYFFWRSYENDKWLASPENLLKYPLLGFISGGFSVYLNWAESYYERSIDSGVLKEVFNCLNITSEQLSTLNKELTIEDLSEDLREIIGVI